MKLEVIRFSSQSDDTLGLLFDTTNGREFLCYTLEDEHREKKVMHETRVPAGTYKVTLRTVGGFHQRYSKRFPNFHKGMLWVREVPNFEYILIHCGNDEGDTSGCLLVGETQASNATGSNGFVGRSSKAYEYVYKKVSEALLAGEDVEITYTDYDGKKD